MQVTFYGVRGSSPASGAEFAKYGGCTPCVSVCLSDGTLLILDSGTGIKKLGDQLANNSDDIHILLSHNHWDHIQGFPFFTPAYQPNRNIFITPGLTDLDEPSAILEQLSGSYFPVQHHQLPSNIKINRINNDVSKWALGCATISRLKINHPGGGSAYLIDDNGVKVAYVTDNELFPPYAVNTTFSEWVEFVSDVDLLIHDAQYTDDDLPLKHGWGHSLLEQAVELAVEANVKRCALFSHDHLRSDKRVDKLMAKVDRSLPSRTQSTQVFAAREGLTLTLSPTN